REQLSETLTKSAVKLEIDAFKKAERKLRALNKSADAVAEQDELVAEIVIELQRPNRVGTNNATRARVAREKNPQSSPAPCTSGGDEAAESESGANTDLP